MFWPWLSKHFLASFNFIMKAWATTNSQFWTKAPPHCHSLHGQCQFTTSPSHASVCRKTVPKTNVRHPPPPLHSTALAEATRQGGYRQGLCVFVCPQDPTLPSPLCHTHPLQSLAVSPSGAFYHDVVSFIRGGLFSTKVGCSLQSEAVWQGPWVCSGLAVTMRTNMFAMAQKVQYIYYRWDNGFEWFGACLAEGYIQRPLLGVMWRWSSSHEAGSTNAMVTRG